MKVEKKSLELRAKSLERKKHPTIEMPKNVDTFLVDCRRELEKAVEEHPYFADSFIIPGYTHCRASVAAKHSANYLDEKVEKEITVEASDVFRKVMTKATLAWFDGDRGEFSKRMAQSVAVQIRAWQLGLKTMKEGGAK